MPCQVSGCPRCQERILSHMVSCTIHHMPSHLVATRIFSASCLHWEFSPHFPRAPSLQWNMVVSLLHHWKMPPGCEIRSAGKKAAFPGKISRGLDTADQSLGLPSVSPILTLMPFLLIGFPTDITLSGMQYFYCHGAIFIFVAFSSSVPHKQKFIITEGHYG